MKKSANQASADKNTQDQRLDELNYPPSQDIMNHSKQLDVDPEALPAGQAPYVTHKAGPVNKEKSVPEEDMGLDVPGAELDDADEAIGEEDEENNYYSLSDDDNDEQNSDGSAEAFEGTEEVKE